MSDLRSKCGLLRLVELQEYPPIELAEVTRPEPIVSVTLTVRALGPEQARTFERLFIEWLETLDVSTATTEPAAGASSDCLKCGCPPRWCECDDGTWLCACGLRCATGERCPRCRR